MHELAQWHVLELARTSPEEFAERPVGAFKALVERDQRHPDRGLLEGVAEAVLGVPQRGLGRAPIGHVLHRAEIATRARWILATERVQHPLLTATGRRSGNPARTPRRQTPGSSPPRRARDRRDARTRRTPRRWPAHRSGHGRRSHTSASTRSPRRSGGPTSTTPPSRSAAPPPGPPAPAHGRARRVCARRRPARSPRPPRPRRGGCGSGRWSATRRPGRRPCAACGSRSG